MERTGRVWTSEAARVVPIVLLTVVGYLLQSALEGEYRLAAANAITLAAGLVVMRVRHRYPVAITVSMSLLMVWFPGLWLVTCWAYLSLATHLRTAATAAVGVLVAVCFAAQGVTGNAGVDVSWALLKELSLPALAAALGVAVLSTVALGALGSYLGVRRREEAAARERLELAKRQQQLEQQNARAEERDLIAREMHDVLAHKITLISLHAGALAYRDDLTPDEVRHTGETIRESAHDALAELRMILGKLRQSEDGGPAKPQPTLADLEALVEGHRAAGLRVVAENRLEGQAPQAVSRHAYRIVQEALTNAARHAPGTTAEVAIDGNEGSGISVLVANPLSLAPAPERHGAGVGLIGVRERVELAGGHLTTGEDGGQFVVKAWLPWQPT